MKRIETRRGREHWGPIGIFVGLVLSLIVHWTWGRRPDSVPPVAASRAPSVGDVVDSNLQWADETGSASLSPALSPVQDFFAQARLGTRAFATDALSFESKWKLVSGTVRGSDDHAQFLQERFATRIFTQESLETVIQSAARDYLKRLDDVDSQLLVRLQADLSGLPSASWSTRIDPQAIETTLNSAIRQSLAAINADLGYSVGLELASFIAGEVLAKAALQLATSSGILATGAASGTVTFGVGVIVGFIVDAIISWAYDKLADPVGELSRRLDETLNALEQQIVAGTADAPGLAPRLRDYTARRNAARSVAIRSVVLP